MTALTQAECEKLVDDLIYAVRDHERATVTVEQRYTRAELDAERTKVLAALSALERAPTDDMLRAAINAMKQDPERIQGFSTPQNRERTEWGPPHWVRDVLLPRDKQELWRGDSDAEMMERCEMERLRIGLTAMRAFVAEK